MISDPNPVLVETILSVSEIYPKCIVMHNIYFYAVSILPHEVKQPYEAK